MKNITLLLLVLLTAVGGAKATEIWTGSCTIGNWSGSSVTVEKSAFGSAEAGNVIRVTFSDYAEKDDKKNEVTSWSYQLQQKDNGWNTLTDFTGGDLRKGQKCASYILTEDDVKTLQEQGLAVNGQWITVAKVELITVTETSSLAATSKSAETLGEWFNYELTWGNKGELVNAQKYDCIRVTYTVLAKGAQLNVNTVQGSWISRAYKWDDTYVEEGTNTGKTLTCTISDATILEMVQQAGVAVSAQNVEITAIDLVKPEDRKDVAPLTIGTDGIATYGSSKHLDFTETGVTPYYATAAEAGKVTLTPTDKTRAWSGCIVKGKAGDYEIPVTTEVGWQDYMHNLVSSGEGGAWVYRSKYSDYSGDNEKIKEYYRYIFSKDNSDNIGFYKLDENYSRIKGESTVYYHELAAHKAYLETANDFTPTEATEARVALAFDDGELTGIQSVRKQTINDNVYYTLSGQRVAQPTKGLYIVNGKKVVIK